jgi:hypothetical protein
MDEKLLRKAMALGFTEPEVRFLCRRMNQVWQYIGSDFAEVAGDVPRESVFEAVVDAGRMNYGPHGTPRGCLTFSMSLAEEMVVIQRFYALGWNKMKVFEKLAFPFSLYE